MCVGDDDTREEVSANPVLASIRYADDMTWEESRGIYSHGCRCSGVYEISTEQLEGGFNTICCSNCSRETPHPLPQTRIAEISFLFLEENCPSLIPCIPCMEFHEGIPSHSLVCSRAVIFFYRAVCVTVLYEIDEDA